MLFLLCDFLLGISSLWLIVSVYVERSSAGLESPTEYCVDAQPPQIIESWVVLCSSRVFHEGRGRLAQLSTDIKHPSVLNVALQNSKTDLQPSTFCVTTDLPPPGQNDAELSSNLMMKDEKNSYPAALIQDSLT